MQNLFDAMRELNPYFLFLSSIFSLICGLLLPEISNVVYPKGNEPLGLFGFKWIVALPFAMLVACFPGAILASTVNPYYGRVALFAWLIGFLIRRSLNMAGVGRDPRSITK